MVLVCHSPLCTGKTTCGCAYINTSHVHLVAHTSGNCACFVLRKRNLEYCFFSLDVNLPVDFNRFLVPCKLPFEILDLEEHSDCEVTCLQTLCGYEPDVMRDQNFNLKLSI